MSNAVPDLPDGLSSPSTTFSLVGLTGGIGAGKSVISRILRLRGESVYDCDIEARRLMQCDPALREALTSLCGPEIYDAEGCLDRKRMSGLIFGDGRMLREVNRLVHSAVRRDMFLRKEEIREEGKERMFVESAVLFSSGLSRETDEIWIVEAPEDLRIARVGIRSGLTPDEVRSRIEAQRVEAALETDGKPVRIILNAPGQMLLPQLD